MSYQASAWFAHTCHYLDGIDLHLTEMFVRAMTRAGVPEVGEAAALEAILADFLAGFDLREPETCAGCGSRIDEGDHVLCAARAWRPARREPPP